MKNTREMVDRQYGVGDLLQRIETGLKHAGKDINSLKVDDLMPVDEFHTRGRKATREMADLVNLKDTDRVLDVGCGLGGTARFLANEYKCNVNGIDLTEVYIAAGKRLTEFVNLSDRVALRHGSALDLPHEDEIFDIVWTQHVQMNIADKQRFYSEIARVLKPGGLAYISEPVFAGDFNEVLPWQHLDTGVDHEFLLAELEKTQAGLASGDGRSGSRIRRSRPARRPSACCGARTPPGPRW